MPDTKLLEYPSHSVPTQNNNKLIVLLISLMSTGNTNEGFGREQSRNVALYEHLQNISKKN